MKHIVLFILLTFHFTYAHAKLIRLDQRIKINHVIYLTLDGVRWQDVYQTRANFPQLWNKHVNKLIFYGVPNSSSTMEIASIPAGRYTKALPQYLFEDLHFRKKDIAIFSSWPMNAYDIESKPGIVYSNLGNVPAQDPFAFRPDGVMEILNENQKTDHPAYKPNRYDKYTFSQALHYFEKYKPKFLWVALVNADDEARLQHVDEYRRLLAFYDDALDALFDTLTSMKLDKDTMVIVTTEHDGDNPELKQTWAFIMNGQLQSINNDGGVYHYSTLSIRPTIEKAFR